MRLGLVFWNICVSPEVGASLSLYNLSTALSSAVKHAHQGSAGTLLGLSAGALTTSFLIALFTTLRVKSVFWAHILGKRVQEHLREGGLSLVASEEVPAPPELSFCPFARTP